MNPVYLMDFINKKTDFGGCLSRMSATINIERFDEIRLRFWAAQTINKAKPKLLMYKLAAILTNRNHVGRTIGIFEACVIFQMKIFQIYLWFCFVLRICSLFIGCMHISNSIIYQNKQIDDSMKREKKISNQLWFGLKCITGATLVNRLWWNAK